MDPSLNDFPEFSLFQDLLAQTAVHWVHLLSYLSHRSSGPQEGIPLSPPSPVRHEAIHTRSFKSTYIRGSQLDTILPPGIFGNIWRLFWLSQLGGGAPGISWVETRDADNDPTMHRTAPAAKKYLAPNVSSGKVEKP